MGSRLRFWVWDIGLGKEPLRNMTPQQRYVSRELTHFVGRILPSDDERFALMLKIIQSGVISSKPDDFQKRFVYGFVSGMNVMERSPVDQYAMACFCDIPLADVGIHMQKYSTFGIAFDREFLVRHGARPVLYIPRGGQRKLVGDTITTTEMINRGVKQLQELVFAHIGREEGPNEARSLRRIALEAQRFLHIEVISFMQPFDSTLGDDDANNVYMEREWRVVDGVRFALQDISRIIIPKHYGKRFRDAFPDYYGQVSFVE